MAVIENTYTGNGSTTTFSFTFPYLNQTDVKASLDGVDVSTFTYASATSIQFNTAPTSGQAIRIYRQTPTDELNREFYPGSTIRAQDLNENALQVLYATQEQGAYATSLDSSIVAATANLALSNSATALTTAETAEGVANAIAATAASAVTTANTANSTANTALTTANSASSLATAAQTTANNALPLAGGQLLGNVDNVATGYFDIPSGTTAQRPGTPNTGMIRYNTSTSSYEGYGATGWASIGGGATGAAGDQVFYENGQTVNTSYTITTNRNAVTAGPVTIANGVTVTVPSGSSWVIV